MSGRGDNLSAADDDANIHARDKDGNTALNIAERTGYTRIKALLLR